MAALGIDVTERDAVTGWESIQPTRSYPQIIINATRREQEAKAEYYQAMERYQDGLVLWAYVSDKEAAYQTAQMHLDNLLWTWHNHPEELDWAEDKLDAASLRAEMRA